MQENTQHQVLLPLHNGVIVEPEAMVTKTAGGMEIPDEVQERPSRGVVIAAGPGLKGQPTQVMEGDTVLYQKGSGSQIDYDGKVYILMPEYPCIQAIVSRKPFDNSAIIEAMGGTYWKPTEKPVPLFTIVLEEAVQGDENGNAGIVPAKVYKEDVKKMVDGGILINARTGASFRVNNILGIEEMEISISSATEGIEGVILLSGDKLDYYPPAEQKEEKPASTEKPTA